MACRLRFSRARLGPEATTEVHDEHSKLGALHCRRAGWGGFHGPGCRHPRAHLDNRGSVVASPRCRLGRGEHVRLDLPEPSGPRTTHRRVGRPLRLAAVPALLLRATSTDLAWRYNAGSRARRRRSVSRGSAVTRARDQVRSAPVQRRSRSGPPECRSSEGRGRDRSPVEAIRRDREWRTWPTR